MTTLEITLMTAAVASVPTAALIYVTAKNWVQKEIDNTYDTIESVERYFTTAKEEIYREIESVREGLSAEIAEKTTQLWHEADTLTNRVETGIEKVYDTIYAEKEELSVRITNVEDELSAED